MKRIVLFFPLLFLFVSCHLLSSRVTIEDFNRDTTVTFIANNKSSGNLCQVNQRLYEKYIAPDTNKLSKEVRVLALYKFVFNIEVYESHMKYQNDYDAYKNEISSQYSAALSVIRKKIQQYPTYPELYYTSAVIKVDLKDYADALLDINQAIEYDNKKAIIIYLKGIFVAGWTNMTKLAHV